ncbi:hypothetical protein [Nocardia sp. NPDC046763]|uniref:hypothetical protein n=1 Tax=Nocardia sp. NPDC046763 TaxID=3155256 RepID=UPI0033C79AB9
MMSAILTTLLGGAVGSGTTVGFSHLAGKRRERAEVGLANAGAEAHRTQTAISWSDAAERRLEEAEKRLEHSDQRIEQLEAEQAQFRSEQAEFRVEQTRLEGLLGDALDAIREFIAIVGRAGLQSAPLTERLRAELARRAQG